MNSYYEAHITMIGEPAKIQPQVELLKWKFSKIDGDPTLGDGVKCYATKHYKASEEKNEVLHKLHLAAYILSNTGITIIRRKIELVIYDDRSSTVRFQCVGNCIECHTGECV